jgi:transcriptional regulator with XRE-family HTH domain
MAAFFAMQQNVLMAKKPKKHGKGGGPGHFIRQWREHRDLTLERLAERVGLTHGTLSRIERGKTAYTQPVLEALADALNTTPASLIMRNPADPDAFWDLLEAIPAQSRSQVGEILKTFAKKTGTNG